MNQNCSTLALGHNYDLQYMYIVYFCNEYISDNKKNELLKNLILHNESVIAHLITAVSM